MGPNRKYLNPLIAFAILGLSVQLVTTQALSFEQRTVCELLKSPKRFTGRLVSVRAEMIAVRDFALVDPTDRRCGVLASAFPEDPEVTPNPGFTMLRDKNYDELQQAFPILRTTPSGTRGSIVATIEGRFDWTPRGSGHMQLRRTRLVWHRVLDIVVIPPR